MKSKTKFRVVSYDSGYDGWDKDYLNTPGRYGYGRRLYDNLEDAMQDAKKKMEKWIRSMDLSEQLNMTFKECWKECIEKDKHGFSWNCGDDHKHCVSVEKVEDKRT